jgi:hypothetical protein
LASLGGQDNIISTQRLKNFPNLNNFIQELRVILQAIASFFLITFQHCNSSLPEAFPPQKNEQLWAYAEGMTESTLNFLQNGDSILKIVSGFAALGPWLNQEYRQDPSRKSNIIIDSTKRALITFCSAFILSKICFPITDAWRSWADKYAASKNATIQQQQLALQQAEINVKKFFETLQKSIIHEEPHTKQAKLKFCRTIQTILHAALNHQLLYEFDFEDAFIPGEQFEIPGFQLFQQEFKELIRMFLAPCSYAHLGYKGNFITKATNSALTITKKKWPHKTTVSLPQTH